MDPDAAEPCRPPGWLTGPAARVAPRLLGMRLSVHHDGVTVAVRIEEVEAYDQQDPASHTFRGPTARNRVMFGPAGHLYVYRSHGIHLCANVVCGPEGHGAAVLVRGGTVVDGRAAAVDRRAGRDTDAWLAAGPGRLCQGLGMRADDDGRWLLGAGPVRLAGTPRADLPAASSEGIPDGASRVDTEAEVRAGAWADAGVGVGPRVGVSRAPDRPWRFWLLDAPGVSTYRRSPRAPRGA